MNEQLIAKSIENSWCYIQPYYISTACSNLDNSNCSNVCLLYVQYGIKKKEEKEAEAQAAMEQASEGSLTRPKKAVPTGCGDNEDEEESIVDTVMKFLPGPLVDMFNKK